jgi:pyruvate/2-oxoglutarate dehydrogenase complex dihydrolipoamide dehydrogenase (E3) component
MVIGGGVAGLEAARVTSMRGHKVTLYEKGKELGGVVLFGSRPPGKEKLMWFRDYLVTQIKKQGVEIKLNKEVGLEDVEKEKPDVVFLATGSQQLIPNIPGIKGSNVVLAWDLLTGRVKLEGKNIGILGGGTVGCEIAEFLVKQGNKVTVIEMLSDIANDMEPINRRALLNELEKSGVVVRTRKKVNEVTHNGVVVIDMESGEKQSLVFDKLILALGVVAVQDLMKAIEGKVKELYLAGDSDRPRTILEAVSDAFLIGYKI